jgi:acetyl esterase
MGSYVLEAPAQGLVEALSNFPPLYEMSPVDARGVVDNVQAAPVPKLDIDESWVTVPLEFGGDDDGEVRPFVPWKAL